jgi:hypothetical protein
MATTNDNPALNKKREHGAYPNERTWKSVVMRQWKEGNTPLIEQVSPEFDTPEEAEAFARSLDVCDRREIWIHSSLVD